MELLCHCTAAWFGTALRSLLFPHPDPGAGATGCFTVLGFFLVASLRGAEGGLKLSSVPFEVPEFGVYWFGDLDCVANRKEMDI